MKTGQPFKKILKILFPGNHVIGDVRVLSTLEKDSLKIFVEYGAVATVFRRFRPHHILLKNENLKNRCLEMKRIADNIHAMPNEDFLKLFF